MYFYLTVSINGRQGKGVKLNILLCSYGEQEVLNGLMMSMEVWYVTHVLESYILNYTSSLRKKARRGWTHTFVLSPEHSGLSLCCAHIKFVTEQIATHRAQSKHSKPSRVFGGRKTFSPPCHQREFGRTITGVSVTAQWRLLCLPKSSPFPLMSHYGYVLSPSCTLAGWVSEMTRQRRNG